MIVVYIDSDSKTKPKEIGKSLVFVVLISNECSFELILDRFFILFGSQS